MEDQICKEDAPLLAKPTLVGRDRARARWITVEPVIALSILGLTTTALIRPLFIKERIRASYNLTDINNNTESCRSAGNTTVDYLDKMVQEESARWLLYISIAAGLPAIVSSAALSTVSDRLGRKLSIMLSLLGFIVQDVAYLATIHFELPLSVVFAGDIATGLTGGFALMFSCCTAYLADITTVRQRTTRIVIAEMVMALFSGLNLLGEGYLAGTFGFLPPIEIALGVQFLALLYTAVPHLLVETVETSDISGYKQFLEVGRDLVKLFKLNENGRRWRMILLNLFIFFSLVETTGISSILVLYGSAKPFCWDASTTGFAFAFGMVSSSFGLLIGTKLFSICLGEYWLMQIGCLSLFLSFLIIGLASSTLIVFFALFMGSLKGMTTPVARSVLSKIAHADDIGAMFAIVAALETLSTLVSGLIGNGVYAATVAYSPPLTFFVFAGCAFVPAGLVLALQIVWPGNNPGTVVKKVSVNSQSTSTASK